MRLFVNSVWACCIEVLATAGQPGAGNKDGLLGFAILVGSLASALAPGLRASAVAGAMCGAEDEDGGHWSSGHLLGHEAAGCFGIVAAVSVGSGANGGGGGDHKWLICADWRH